MATVPMFAPDGTLGDIPAAKLQDALKAGFKQGVTMKSQDGKLGVVPADRMMEASKGGLTPVPLQEQETQHAGFWNSLGGDLKQMVKGIPQMAASAIPGVGLAMQDPAAQAQHAQEQKKAGYGAAYRILATPAAEGVGVNVRGMEQSAKEGDVAGVAGHAAAVPTAMAITAGVTKAAPVISDVASAAADRAAMAAEKAKAVVANVTPKQAMQVAGGTSGAVAGHGPLSIPGAYYGAKTFGHIAEAVLGKDRANSPIFKNADLPLDSLADSLAQTIADDRARVAANQSKGLGMQPATGAKSAAQSGEALATKPTSIDLTEPPIGGKAAPRFNAADRAAAKSLLQDALKQHSQDIVDSAIPPTGDTQAANRFTKAKVDALLRRGDVGGAENALDAAAKQANPTWQPMQRQVVPSVQDIRARVQAEAKSSGRADALDTQALQQQMRYDLERHGWSAESEARREFIARNSNDYVKTEHREFGGPALLSDQLPGESTPKIGKAGKVAAQPSASADLTDILQKSLDEARRKQKGK